MAGIISYIPIINRLFSQDDKSRTINLPSVEVHYIETSTDRRARCLKHLLRANHVSYSVLYHNLQYDNHNPHVLSSAYMLGATEAQLHTIYDAQIKELEPWEPSPSELMDEDWRDFLGNKKYQRAFLDYFEDNHVMEYDYNWKSLLHHYLFSGDKPLFHGLICGLGHPLIHLGYAYEVDSKEVAMEALTLTAVQYDFLHKYLDDPSYTRPSALEKQTPLDLLIKMSKDKRFAAIQDPSFDKLESIFQQHEDLLLEYWNGWQIDDALKQFELSQEAAAAILIATVRPGTHAYNFLLVHLLTTSHAVRILLPFFPASHHITLVRQWWLLVIAVFVIKGRPMPDPDNLEQDVKHKQWRYVEDKALNSEWSKDAHYIKAIRALREAARTWGDVHNSYLKSAVTFVDNFDGWTF